MEDLSSERNTLCQTSWLDPSVQHRGTSSEITGTVRQQRALLKELQQSYPSFNPEQNPHLKSLVQNSPEVITAGPEGKKMGQQPLPLRDGHATLAYMPLRMVSFFAFRHFSLKF